MSGLPLALVLSWLVAPQDKPAVSYTLKTGQSLTGNVVKLDGDEVTLRIKIFDGFAETTRKLGDFTPRSACNIQSATLRADSFDDHFKLAKYAVENGVLDVAGTEAGIAKQIADKTPGGPQVAELHKWAADTLEKLFHDAVAKGDVPKADHFLKVLMTRVPEQRTDAQKNAMLGELDRAEQKKQDELADQKKAKVEAAAAKEQERQLAPIRKELEEGKKLAGEGLVQAGSTGTALNKLDDAITHYRTAWKATEKLQKSSSTDAALKKEAGNLAEQILENGINAGLSAAHLLTARSDYQKASEYVNKILALDPDNDEAKDLRRTIELASSSSGWGWGWGYRR